MSRSLDFCNDPQLSEYQPLVQKVFAVIGPLMERGAPPEQVAESVYAATTDDSNQLRYEVGVANRRCASASPTSARRCPPRSA